MFASGSVTLPLVTLAKHVKRFASHLLVTRMNALVKGSFSCLSGTSTIVSVVYNITDRIFKYHWHSKCPWDDDVPHPFMLDSRSISCPSLALKRARYSSSCCWSDNEQMTTTLSCWHPSAAPLHPKVVQNLSKRMYGSLHVQVDEAGAISLQGPRCHLTLTKSRFGTCTAPGYLLPRVLASAAV